MKVLLYSTFSSPFTSHSLFSIINVFFPRYECVCISCAVIMLKILFGGGRMKWCRDDIATSIVMRYDNKFLDFKMKKNAREIFAVWKSKKALKRKKIRKGKASNSIFIVIHFIYHFFPSQSLVNRISENFSFFLSFLFSISFFSTFFSFSYRFYNTPRGVKDVALIFPATDLHFIANLSHKTVNGFPFPQSYPVFLQSYAINNQGGSRKFSTFPLDLIYNQLSKLLFI